MVLPEHPQIAAFDQLHREICRPFFFKKILNVNDSDIFSKLLKGACLFNEPLFSLLVLRPVFFIRKDEGTIRCPPLKQARRKILFDAAAQAALHILSKIRNSETALSQTLAQQVFSFQDGERYQMVFHCGRFFHMIPAVLTRPMLHRFLKANRTKLFFQTHHLLSHPRPNTFPAQILNWKISFPSVMYMPFARVTVLLPRIFSSPTNVPFLEPRS